MFFLKLGTHITMSETKACLLEQKMKDWKSGTGKEGKLMSWCIIDLAITVCVINSQRFWDLLQSLRKTISKPFPPRIKKGSFIVILSPSGIKDCSWDISSLVLPNCVCVRDMSFLQVLMSRHQRRTWVRSKTFRIYAWHDKLSGLTHSKLVATAMLVYEMKPRGFEVL